MITERKETLHPAVTETWLDMARMKQEVTPRSLTDFKDVACRVFAIDTQNINARNAMRRLRRFINTDPELRERMDQAGYRPRSHYLTYKQMHILCEYIA